MAEVQNQTQEVQAQAQEQKEVELVLENSRNRYVEDVAILTTKDKVRVPKGKKAGDVELRQGENEVEVKVGIKTYKAKLIVEDEITVRGRTRAIRRRLILSPDVARMVVAVIRFKPYEKPEIVYGSGSVIYGREWDEKKRVWRTKVYYVNLSRGIKVDLGWWEQ